MWCTWTMLQGTVGCYQPATMPRATTRCLVDILHRTIQEDLSVTLATRALVHCKLQLHRVHPRISACMSA